MMSLVRAGGNKEVLKNPRHRWARDGGRGLLMADGRFHCSLNLARVATTVTSRAHANIEIATK